MTDDWQKEQERQTRIAARTRERPFIREMILIHLEMHRWDLLTLWRDMVANPDEVLTVLTAGHETMASALSWAWYLLGRHPRTQDDLGTRSAADFGGATPARPQTTCPTCPWPGPCSRRRCVCTRRPGAHRARP
jgi:hypothetical protein